MQIRTCIYTQGILSMSTKTRVQYLISRFKNKAHSKLTKIGSKSLLFTIKSTKLSQSCLREKKSICLFVQHQSNRSCLMSTAFELPKQNESVAQVIPFAGPKQSIKVVHLKQLHSFQRLGHSDSLTLLPVLLPMTPAMIQLCLPLSPSLSPSHS